MMFIRLGSYPALVLHIAARLARLHFRSAKIDRSHFSTILGLFSTETDTRNYGEYNCSYTVLQLQPDSTEALRAPNL